MGPILSLFKCGYRASLRIGPPISGDPWQFELAVFIFLSFHFLLKSDNPNSEDKNLLASARTHIIIRLLFLCLNLPNVFSPLSEKSVEQRYEEAEN